MKQIVEYTFDLLGYPIDLSGHNNHGLSTATVALSGAAGAQAAGFLAPTSRIVIPYNTSWAHLGAVRINARIRFDALDQRANIVEIDRSTVLFVRPDGIVTFVVYAPKPPEDIDPDAEIDSFTTVAPPIAPTDPFDTLVPNPPPPYEWIGLNTEAAFSPDATTRSIPIGSYVSIAAEHDGLGTMRIWIDAKLAAIRQDLRHKVLPLFPPGQVTIGASALDNAFTLRGAIDRLRIWREDPQEPYETFFCRQMPDQARECWRSIYRNIATDLADPDRAELLTELLKLMDNFAKTLAKALARLEGDDRQRLFKLSATYKRLWCQNALDTPTFEHTVGEMLALIDTVLPGSLYDLFGQIFSRFSNEKTAAILMEGACIDGTDPNWPHYLRAVSNRFPLPPGIRPEPYKDKRQETKD